MKSLAPNTLIQNRYLVVHLIGKGGMGEVYLAVDQRLGSAVALKRTLFADDEMLGSAFEREARTLARLRHPVLPKVSDHFLEDSGQYLVMEHIAGDDLCKRLEAAQKPFPTNWVLYWADQLLDALSYLHSHEPPIIHRDIKPQNLKLTDDNQIILLDFGLSKNSTNQSQASRGSGGSTGSVVGYTPHYAPMEQIRGTGTGPRSDLYSLSATLYQLLTNTVPADALTRADSMLGSKPDPVKPISDLNPEVSPAVSEVILQGMEVTQDKRFANAKEMQRALRKAYSSVQDAMTANTVAFNAADHVSAAAEGGHIAGSPSGAPLVNGQEPARVRVDRGIPSSPGPVAPPPESPDFDATIRYSAPLPEVPVRQADVKTEVFTRGQIPSVHVVDEPTPKSPLVDGTAVEIREDTQQAADETRPAFTFEPDSASPEVSQPATPEFFTTPAEAADQYATHVAAAGPAETSSLSSSQSVPQETPVRESVVARPATEKKSSKGLAVAAVLGVLFILAIGAAGGGWYFYSNYFVKAHPSPTPSPQPTVLATPTPAPSVETVAETNSNTNSAPPAADTNTNSSTGELTTERPSEPGAGNTFGQPRSTSQTATKKTPAKPVQTAPTGPKATPKPKAASSRPDIMQ